MNCEAFRDWMPAFLAGELPAAEREGFEAHRAACAACAAELARLRAAEEGLRGHFAALREGARPAALPQRSAEPSLLLPRALSWAAGLALATGLAALLFLREGAIPPAYGEVEVKKLGYAVTAFQDGWALVRDRRQILNLKPGVNRFRFEDVPARLDPASVRFLSLTDPAGCSVLEQNFEYDLVSREKLLSRYIDREIAFERREVPEEGPGTVERSSGRLLSADGAVRMGSGEIRTAFPGEAILPEIPGGLLTRPALAWVLSAPRESRHETVVSYLAQGISWRADYVLTLRDGKTLDLSGWVSLTNESGAAYPEAALKLVAGDVHRVEPELILEQTEALEKEEDEAKSPPDPGFTEKAFFEYHLYTLGRPTTLKDRETKQISLLGAEKVGYRTEHVYEPEADARVRAFVVFRNEPANRLGIPLPAGQVRLRTIDRDGEAEQVGLASIDHLPKGEEVRILRGRAVDLVGEAKRLERRRGNGWSREKWEIRLRNHSDAPETVKVVKHIGGSVVESAIRSSLPWKRKDAERLEFDIPVEPGKEALLELAWERRWD